MLGPSDIRALLDEYGIRPSRALGQNFLADPNIARKIVRAAELESDARVLEIGPGIGSLTLALAPAAREVIALEFDRHLLPALEQVLNGSNIGNVRVVHGDAIRVDYHELLDGDGWVVVANLPYNVATPLVATLLDYVPNVQRLLVMVQREVAERLAASPGDNAYGAVSVKVAYHAVARIVATVPPTVFIPRPAVESALVSITRRRSPAIDVEDSALLFALVRAGFAQRRKTLRQALKAVTGANTDAVLDGAEIDRAARAEQLTLEQWAALTAQASS